MCDYLFFTGFLIFNPFYRVSSRSHWSKAESKKKRATCRYRVLPSFVCTMDSIAMRWGLPSFFYRVSRMIHLWNPFFVSFFFFAFVGWFFVVCFHRNDSSSVEEMEMGVYGHASRSNLRGNKLRTATTTSLPAPSASARKVESVFFSVFFFSGFLWLLDGRRRDGSDFPT